MPPTWPRDHPAYDPDAEMRWLLAVEQADRQVPNITAEWLAAAATARRRRGRSLRSRWSEPAARLADSLRRTLAPIAEHAARSAGAGREARDLALAWAAGRAASILERVRRTGGLGPNLRQRLNLRLFERRARWRSTAAVAARDVAAATARAVAARGTAIARTETIRAVNVGLQIGGRGDQKPFKIWVVTRDDRTCQYCLALDGQKIPLDGTFDGGRFGRVKGPPLHPNCRCALALGAGGSLTDIARPGVPTPPHPVYRLPR